MKTILSLQSFYRLMRDLAAARRRIVRRILGDAPVEEPDLGVIRGALERLDSLPSDGGRTVLRWGDGTIPVRLDYETESLRKDLSFLSGPAEAFPDLLAELNGMPAGRFRSAVEEAGRFLEGWRFASFFTDRDGTVNGYCGRYRSSVQPVHAAVFLSRFAKTAEGCPLILTSAPLDEFLEVNVSPEELFHLAGSSGREYRAWDGTRGSLPLPEAAARALARLNDSLGNILDVEGNRIFTLIGSGLQLKAGSTVVAYRDISGSVPEDRSTVFKALLRETVGRLDPDGNRFMIIDTGLDLEITPVDPGGHVFTKGDGIRFLAGRLPLRFDRGTTLVCGDSDQDLSMLETVLEFSRDVAAIFVTTDGSLMGKVPALCPDALFVPSPDVLLCALGGENGRT